MNQAMNERLNKYVVEPFMEALLGNLNLMRALCLAVLSVFPTIWGVIVAYINAPDVTDFDPFRRPK